MKITGSGLLRDSLFYALRERSVWFLIGGALVFVLCFIFLIEGRFYLGLGDAYLYEAVRTILQFFWQLWVVGFVIASLKKQSPSFVGSAVSALYGLFRSWWLVGWLILLQWAGIPLLREPYCYSENIDLILVVLVGILNVVQIFFNFILLPEIAGGEYSFCTLVYDVYNKIKKNYIMLVWFFFLVGIFLVAAAIAILFVLSVIQAPFEYAFNHELLAPLFKMIWLYLTGFIVFAVLAIAQALVYVNGLPRK